MTELASSRWLPVALELDRFPAVVSDASLRWMEFDGSTFAEPFFEQTISRLRQSTPAVREIDTDLETLLRAGKTRPKVAPAGFIFHVSHCGSTLVANALKTAKGAVVVAEHPVVANLLLPHPEPLSGW